MKVPLDMVRLERAVKKVSPNAVKLVAPMLLNDLKKNGVDLKAEDKLFSLVEMRDIEHEILTQLREMDRRRKLPYHNVQHTKSVLKRSRILASKAKLNKNERQVLELAALFHDYEHGSPISSSRNGRLTYEERSAIQADAYLRKKGFSIKQRLTLYGLIIGTTFSNPAIQPKTKLEKMLVIADLGGFNNSSKEWLVESMHVTQEIPFEHRPKNVKVWLREQQKFLDYVRKRLTPEARKLAWAKSLDRKNSLLKKLIYNPEYHKAYTPIVKKIKRMLPSAI